MKKIIFDLMVSQPVLGSKFHGGGEYAKTVFKELCLNYSNEVELSAFYDPERYIDDWVINIAQKSKVKLLAVKNYNDVSNLDDFKKADTFVACLMQGVTKVKKPENMRIIGVYHGFRELEKPVDWTSPLYDSSIKNKIKSYLKILGKNKYFQKKYNEHRKKIEVCSDIVGVSNHSGYSAEVFFPEFDRSHVHVFYSPQKNIEYKADACSIKQEKTILMLGGDRWVKNVYRGVKAIDELFINGQLNEYTVKIVGGIPKPIEKKIVNRSRFVSLNYLSSEELENEYCACEIFFYPTLNEGFGYPPEEVMKYGKTCVISGINSLIEVYQDSVYYCNPYDINEMKCRLLQASKEKISKDTIRRNMDRIIFKQKNDLEKFCHLIIGDAD